jgi:ATP-dependent HslUV protease ATP-binding subunit HslU
LVGPGSGPATRDSFRKKLRAGELQDKEIELTLADTGQVGGMDIPGQAGIGVVNLSEMLSKAMGGRTKSVRLTVAEAWPPLIQEESDKLLDQEALTKEALLLTENEGIVFLDEIDKVASRQDRAGADVSREGVQRDLLPIVEGSAVNTKHGVIQTDHILFIAAGAFHVSKPSDLIPELQGRFPIRVELNSLTEGDFYQILKAPKNALTKQYSAMMESEGVELEFEDGALREIARIAFEVNSEVENIGARRLQTVMSLLLNDFMFDIPDVIGDGSHISITAEMVQERLSALVKNRDLSQYIL